MNVEQYGITISEMQEDQSRDDAEKAASYDENEVDATRAKFSKRFDNIKTIPGTRSFHEFIPTTANEIGVKFCSEDQDICQTYNFGNDFSVLESLDLKVLEYVCCTYSENL